MKLETTWEGAILNLLVPPSIESATDDGDARGALPVLSTYATPPQPANRPGGRLAVVEAP